MTRVVRGQKLTKIVTLTAAVLLTACAFPGHPPTHAGITIESAVAGQLSVLRGHLLPVLVVKSPAGIGHARLQVQAPLTHDVTIELPNFTRLEELVLENDQRMFVCVLAEATRAACRWGEQEVGTVQRYAGGIIVQVPALIFQKPGEWTLRWVNEFR